VEGVRTKSPLIIIIIIHGGRASPQRTETSVTLDISIAEAETIALEVARKKINSSVMER